MLVSRRVVAGVLRTWGMKGRFNLLQKFLVSTFDVKAYEVLERYGLSPQEVTRLQMWYNNSVLGVLGLIYPGYDHFWVRK